MRRCTGQKAKFDKIFKGAAVHDPSGSVGFGVVCDKAIFHLVGQYPAKRSLSRCFLDTASSRRVE
jgi:hypothetical protein